MEKTIFEQMGGTYTQQGDCYLPNSSSYPPKKKQDLLECGGNGIYGI